MKITEELLNEMKIKDENFSDGLIKPDGDYVRIPRGHLHGMMELLPWTENEIWKMIPDDDSPLFWLIEKTGCVLTDYNNSIGMKMTPAQQTVFDMMRKHGGYCCQNDTGMYWGLVWVQLLFMRKE